MGIKTPEELNIRARNKMAKLQNRSGSAAHRNNNLSKQLEDGGQGAIAFDGSCEGRARVKIDPRATAKATVRANIIKNGGLPDEPPPMRGLPSHEQYQYKCEREKLEFMVSHDGFMIYHPAYDIPPYELSNDECAELGIDPADFNKTGLDTYNKATYKDLSPSPVKEGQTVTDPNVLNQETSVPAGQVMVKQEQLDALFKRLDHLEEEQKKVEDKHPIKKWNGYVTQLINKGELSVADCEARYSQMGVTLAKEDVADLLKVESQATNEPQ